MNNSQTRHGRLLRLLALLSLCALFCSCSGVEVKTQGEVLTGVSLGGSR